MWKARSAYGFTASKPSLFCPGVPQFHKKGPVGLGDVDIGHAQIIIRITDEQNGLGIELIGEKELGEYGLGLVRNREKVKIQISRHIQILHDHPDKRPDIKIIDEFHLRQVGRENFISFKGEPLISMLEIDIDVPPQAEF